ncbi:MAG: translation initiation factor IF-2 subunit alpha [Candidatus Bathyarchaeia archaeon]
MSVAPRYPEVGDLVVASVTRVVDYGAYVKLDEYESVEGLIHISEIASTYVKNIRVHVREGQKLVLKVLRVSSQRAQVDLSLRRVTGREKSEKMLEWKKVKKADSIIKGAAEKLKATEDDVSKVKSIIYEKFDNPFDAFEEATDEGEEIFSKLGISEEWAKTLTEVARSKIRLEKAKVTGTVELTCAKTEGVEAIRQALRGAKKVKKSRGTTIKIYTVGSPRYRLEVRSKEITDAQATLNLAIDEALNSIKSLGGEGRKLS